MVWVHKLIEGKQKMVSLSIHNKVFQRGFHWLTRINVLQTRTNVYGPSWIFWYVFFSKEEYCICYCIKKYSNKYSSFSSSRCRCSLITFKMPGLFPFSMESLWFVKGQGWILRLIQLNLVIQCAGLETTIHWCKCVCIQCKFTGRLG